MKTRLTGERWIISNEKRAFDIAAVAALLPIAIPAGALTLGLCRSFDGRDAIFAQQRHGKDNTLIPVWKIRTMRPANPEAGEAKWITGIGKVVRPFALDEIPQLFNILKGDMSITGPRAYEPGRMKDMEGALPKALFEEWQEAYLVSRPGGFSSYGIKIRGDISADERTYAAKARLDINDFRNASFSHDLALIRKAAAMGISVVQRHLSGPEPTPAGTGLFLRPAPPTETAQLGLESGNT